MERQLLRLDANLTQLAHDPDQPAQLRLDDVETLEHLRILRGGFVEQQLNVAERSGDGIVRVVSHAAHEVDDRGQPVFRGHEGSIRCAHVPEKYSLIRRSDCKGLVSGVRSC